MDVKYGVLYNVLLMVIIVHKNCCSLVLIGGLLDVAGIHGQPTCSQLQIPI